MARAADAEDHELLVLADILASEGRFGVVWLTDDLIVRRAYGAVVDSVVVGEGIATSVLVLIGQEDRISALKAGPDKTLYLPNVAVVRDDGEPVRTNVTVLHDDRVGFVVVFDRLYSTGLAEMMVEDEIRKRRIADAALARINSQLEEFAYVISHDLKAPLRALRYYSGDISEALANDPPDVEAARAAAERVTAACRRMSNMLVGLLEYSRIGRQDEAVDEVDTHLLVQDIAATMALPGRMSLVVEGQWPVLRTPPVPLDLVLRNLIDNAIKHHDRDDGRVRVVAQDRDAMVAFEVIDDGPGIPRDWHEAIFRPFNQIDGSRHVDSSGIGLALVKRTIEAVGGRIEVNSEAPSVRGATFRVFWPKR